MLMLIGLICGVLWLWKTFGDHAGTLALGAVVVLLICMVCRAWGKESRAYGNWVDYWARGGPDRDADGKV